MFRRTKMITSNTKIETTTPKIMIPHVSSCSSLKGNDDVDVIDVAAVVVEKLAEAEDVSEVIESHSW